MFTIFVFQTRIPCYPSDNFISSYFMAFSNDPALNEAEKLKSRCNEILVIAIYLVLVSTVFCETLF